ncbi:hypothetical protein C2E23DRAFT_499775 [Lenzites betulinus]|nr:hypothetical protein C2E23DRAFT_499775 [Lenzites betulinus]
MRKLFQLVAADLWSIVVMVGPAKLDPDERSSIFEPTFPLVREVTFLGIKPPAPAIFVDATLALPTFPAATRLQLAPEQYAHQLQLNLDRWSAIAPCVTHLRVSRVASIGHIQQLAKAIGVHSGGGRPPSQSTSAPTLRTYPGIQRLVIEACTRIVNALDDAVLIQRSITNISLQIVKTCNAPNSDVGVTATFLPEYAHITHEEREGKRLQDWVEQIEDGQAW